MLHIEHAPQAESRPSSPEASASASPSAARSSAIPKAYLFDEPISALDALLRLEMRTELKRLQKDLGRTLVYVTHDQVEAMSMADRILVLREGVVQQIDTPEHVYHSPANRFVATVIGSPPMNFMPATVKLENGSLTAVHGDFAFRTRAPDTDQLKDGDPCWVGIRPEDIRIATSGEDGVPAKVYVTEPLGGETVVDLQFGDRIYKALAPPTLKLSQDQEVRASLDRRRVHLFTEDGDAVVSAAGEDVFEFELSR